MQGHTIKQPKDGEEIYLQRSTNINVFCHCEWLQHDVYNTLTVLNTIYTPRLQHVMFTTH